MIRWYGVIFDSSTQTRCACFVVSLRVFTHAEKLNLFEALFLCLECFQVKVISLEIELSRNKRCVVQQKNTKWEPVASAWVSSASTKLAIWLLLILLMLINVICLIAPQALIGTQWTSSVIHRFKGKTTEHSCGSRNSSASAVIKVSFCFLQLLLITALWL